MLHPATGSAQNVPSGNWDMRMITNYGDHYYLVSLVPFLTTNRRHLEGLADRFNVGCAELLVKARSLRDKHQLSGDEKKWVDDSRINLRVVHNGLIQQAVQA